MSERAPWRERGVGLVVSNAMQVVRVRAVVEDDRLYSLEITGMVSDADAGRFFDSFDARAEPRREAVNDPRLGYRVQAPTCMNRWRDVSDLPPLVGHHGVLDGHQLAVDFNDLLLVPDPEAALDGSVTEMRRAVEGELVEIDPRPFEGRPSRRFEVRSRDGTYGTIRLLLEGSRLYQASVYAPSGHEAPWADAYVDSLSVGP